jgi:hypothetical protein
VQVGGNEWEEGEVRDNFLKCPHRVRTFINHVDCNSSMTQLCMKSDFTFIFSLFGYGDDAEEIVDWWKLKQNPLME